MSKNLKIEYLRKLHHLKTTNNYHINLNQYLYGISHGDQYPAFIKKIKETPEKIRISKVYYFKHYDKTGGYYHQIYEIPNNNDRINIARNLYDKEITADNRFNLNKLVQITENIKEEDYISC